LKIGLSELEALKEGAAVLGCGGGGDTHLSYLLAKQAVMEKGPVALLKVHELDDDDLIIPTAMMGAPIIMSERVPAGDEALASLRALERHLGGRAAATMPIEVGGLNVFTSLTTAALGGMPLVDADGMGRACPELQMCTFNAYGVPCAPMTISSEHGHMVLIQSGDNPSMERVARSVVIGMGGVGYIAAYPMTGKQAKETSVVGTVSLAVRIGRALIEARRRKAHPAGAVLDAFAQSTYGQGMVLIEGRVLEVQRRRTGRAVKGRVVLEGSDSYTGQTGIVQFQNENLTAELNGRVVSTVPDLIVLLHHESGSPVLIENLKVGLKVTCMIVPTPDITVTGEALALWGPRAFGYSCDHRSCREERWR